jgi:ferredoxin
LNAGFYLNMPWNYIIMLSPPKIEKQRKIIRNAKNKITKIVKSINNERKIFDRDIMFFMNLIANRSFIKKVNMEDKKFEVLDSCISCGICVKICPVKNIILVNGKPTWAHNCEQCFGCINICSRNSIQFGKKINNKRRYFNQEIKDEMIVV